MAFTRSDFPYFRQSGDQTSGGLLTGASQRWNGQPLIWTFKTEDDESTINAEGYFNLIAESLGLGDRILVVRVTNRGTSSEALAGSHWIEVQSIDDLTVDTETVVSGTVDDHGGLTGLDDNDHGAVYYTKAEVDALEWAADDITSGEFADARISESSVAQHASAFDHDALTNFVAAEHIDWTSTTENLSTSGTAATGALSVTGDITVSGTVAGRAIATDGGKLDGIEALADVTDAANVAAAGAVMNTGNESIAGVKTFTSDPIIPDEAYGAGWNGSLEPPTKNAAYDKIDAMDTTIAGIVAGTEFLTFDSIASLTAASKAGLVDDGYAIVKGYYAPGDGGGGMFQWDAASTATANIGTIFASDEGGDGRWLRDYKGQNALNVKWFGAVVDGVTDDTAAIQAALDLNNAPVFLPAGSYVVTQLEIYMGTNIYGASCGGPGNMGTRLYQKDGSNVSIIVPKSTIPVNEWVHWVQIRDLSLRGNSESTGGCGIEITRRTGENFLISGVIVNGFPESGIRLTRGSTPGMIFNCASFQNGEYGFDLQRTGVDVWHQFCLRSVSGDNNGTALIRVKSYGAAEDMIFIDGVKSETSEADTQQDVIVLDSLSNAVIKVENVTAQAMVSMRSVVRITGTNARAILGFFRAVSNCTNWVYDDSDTVKTLARESGTTACLIDGVWASYLADPSVNIRTKADF